MAGRDLRHRRPDGPVRPCPTRMSLHSLEWTPFGPPEWGWETYLPLIQKELGTDCAPEFARASPRRARGLPDAPQPAGRRAGSTPRPSRPSAGCGRSGGPSSWRASATSRAPIRRRCTSSAIWSSREEHADRLTRLLRRDVLDAYRRLVAAARAEVPEVARNPELLQIFSGFRDPEADAARCAASGQLRRPAARGLFAAPDRDGGGPLCRPAAGPGRRQHLAGQPPAHDADARPIAGWSRNAGPVRLRALCL